MRAIAARVMAGNQTPIGSFFGSAGAVGRHYLLLFGRSWRSAGGGSVLATGGDKVGARCSLAEEVALALFATKTEEGFGLFQRLDALGNDAEVEILRHGDDGADHGGRVLVLGHALDEGAVDLELVKRQ